MEHKLTSSLHAPYEGAVKNIILIGLVAGTLDALGAIAVYRADPIKLFQFIASGTFGAEKAFSGGYMLALMGVIFHYLIAFVWTTLFFFIYPIFRFIRKNKYIAGLLYGVFVWVMMNQIVLPLTKIPQGAITLKGAVTGASILMIMVGLPISILTHRYYFKRNNAAS